MTHPGRTFQGLWCLASDPCDPRTLRGHRGGSEAGLAPKGRAGKNAVKRYFMFLSSNLRPTQAASVVATRLVVMRAGAVEMPALAPPVDSSWTASACRLPSSAGLRPPTTCPQPPWTTLAVPPFGRCGRRSPQILGKPCGFPTSPQRRRLLCPWIVWAFGRPDGRAPCFTFRNARSQTTDGRARVLCRRRP